MKQYRSLGRGRHKQLGHDQRNKFIPDHLLFGDPGDKVNLDYQRRLTTSDFSISSQEAYTERCLRVGPYEVVSTMSELSRSKGCPGDCRSCTAVRQNRGLYAKG